MKLNVPERLVLLNLLPKRGNYITLKLLRKLQNDLSFSDEEVEYHQIEVDDDNGNVSWKNGNEEKEIEIGKVMTNLIQEELIKLNDKQKLHERHFSLCEKFNLDEALEKLEKEGDTNEKN